MMLAQEHEDHIHDFIRHLEHGKENKKADTKEAKDRRKKMARLRGILRGQPNDYLRAGNYVIPYLFEGSDTFAEECFFQVAGLYAWGDGAIPHEIGISLGDALREIRPSGDASESLDGRFMALLNCSTETLFIHLRQMIDLLRSSKARKVGLDWELLLYDVLKWEVTGTSERNGVRWRWARRYFRATTKSDQSDDTDATDEDGE